MVLTQLRDGHSTEAESGTGIPVVFLDYRGKEKVLLFMLKASIPNYKDGSQEGGKQPGWEAVWGQRLQGGRQRASGSTVWTRASHSCSQTLLCCWGATPLVKLP